MGSLCALLVFMEIGYAIISQMLTIRGVSTVAGDWNIYIDSITPNAIGTGVSVNESVGLDKVSASFEAKYDNLPSNLRSNVTVYYGCSDIDASTCDGIFE